MFDYILNVFDNIWVIIICGIISISLLLFGDYFKRHTITTIIYYLLFPIMFLSGIMLGFVFALGLAFFIALCLYYPALFLWLSLIDYITKIDYKILDDPDRDKLDFKERIRLNKIEIRYYRKGIAKLEIIRFFTYFLLILIVAVFLFSAIALITLKPFFMVLIVISAIIFLLNFDIKEKPDNWLDNFFEVYTTGATNAIDIYNTYINQAKTEIKAFSLNRELNSIEKTLCVILKPIREGDIHDPKSN
jgi:hypothetical protein